MQFVRPDVAVVRHSWKAKGDKNVDGSARPQRFGLMTMVADKRNGVWLVAAVQNTNGPTDATETRTPEAQDMKSGIVVPRTQSETDFLSGSGGVGSPLRIHETYLASLIFVSWNRIGELLRRVDGLRQVA